MPPFIWLKLLEKIKMFSENRDMDMLTVVDSNILMDNKPHTEENLHESTNHSKTVLLEAIQGNHDTSNGIITKRTNKLYDDTDDVNSTLPSSPGNDMSNFEYRLQDFLRIAENKLDLWMKQTLMEVSSPETSSSAVNGSGGTACRDCDSLRSRHDSLLKLNIDREKEVLSLKEELNKKDSVIEDLQKEVKCLAKELNSKNQQLSDMRSATNNTGFEAKIIQLEITTTKQNLQLSALQEQNNKLNAQNRLNDQMICSKQNEINIMSQKIKKYELQRSISHKSFPNLRPRRNTTPGDLHKRHEETLTCGDVVIIHDLFQKGFNVKLLKKKQVSVKEIWANKLKDALSCAENMKIKPKLVLLHTGSKDLMSVPEEEIVKTIVDIYHVLHRRNIKFIWSNLVPQCEDLEVNSKGYFVNMKVKKELTDKPGAYIERNEHFYLRNILHPSILDVIGDDE